MFTIGYSGRFKKDLKIIKKRSEKSFEDLRIFINELQKSGYQGLSPKHRPHKLIGNFSMHWECHVTSDLLLIWLQDDIAQTIFLARVGSHSDLF